MRVGTGGIVFGNKRGMSFGKPFGGSGTGSGSAPILLVFEDDANGAAILNGAAAAGNRAFGDQDVDAGATASATIYIENPGTKELTLSVPTLSGAGASHFALGTGGFLTTVPAAGSTTFTITFDPTSAGSKAAVVSFTHDAGNDATPFTFNLSGAGIDSDIVVREDDDGGTIIAHNEAAASTRAFGQKSVTADVDADLATLLAASVATDALAFFVPHEDYVTTDSFGVTNVDAANDGTYDLTQGTDAAKPAFNGGSPGASTFAVVNTGSTPMTVSLALGGTDPTHFTLDQTGFTSPIAPGAFKTFTVEFTPTTVGAKSCTVLITHNDDEVANPFILNFTGTAVTGRSITFDGVNDYLTGNAALLAAISGIDDFSMLIVAGDPQSGRTLIANVKVTGTLQEMIESSTATAIRSRSRRVSAIVSATLSSLTFSATPKYHAMSADRNANITYRRAADLATTAGVEDAVTPTWDNAQIASFNSGFFSNTEVYLVAYYVGLEAETNQATYKTQINTWLAAIDAGFTV